MKVKIKTVIVDKKYINKKMQLNMALAREIGQLTKAEKYFFNGKDFRHIINLLKNKRI